MGLCTCLSKSKEDFAVRRFGFAALVFALVLVLLSPTANAQFGKLKDLAKDKLKGKKEQTQQAPSSTSTPSSTSATGSSSQSSGGSNSATSDSGYVNVPVERPANLAANMNISRQRGGTPEARPTQDKRLFPGKPEEVTFKLVNIDASQIDSLRAQKLCTVSAAKLTSANELKVTIQAPLQDSSDDCYFDFRTAEGKYLAGANIYFMSKSEIASAKRQEIAMAESRLPEAEMKALVRKRVGKTWAVEFENGTSQQWTVVGADPDNPYGYRFRSSNGKPVTIQYMAGGNYVIGLGDDCMITGDGYEHEGNVTGMAMGEGCGAPLGTKFTAKVQ